MFIVNIEVRIQNHKAQSISHKNVTNCSAHETLQISSSFVCSVIIADTTGFITDRPNAMQKDTTNIIQNDKSNHNITNSHAKKTSTTAINNFLLNHSSRPDTNRLKIYGNLIAAKTNAI